STSAAPAAPHAHGALAHTGADHTLQTVAAGAALVLGGVVLRRRRRPQTASATPVSSTIPESP
ncbi:LPXTG cell wall anchor domain-containing protein, partial [Streptomyces africanus]|uniref:LPXTG cell wall anchor domain-containing protein n=1 Tax=Streptomyces africanus TaxID=231024 RepID=UPI00117E18DD